jgi:hypothetical protein
MEGHKEEVLANRKKHREARDLGKSKLKSLSGPSGTSKSVQHDGHTYIHSGHAFCVNIPKASTTFNATTTDFATLAMDEMTSSFLAGLSSADQLEYKSYTLLDLPDNLRTSVDWSENQHLCDLSALAVQPINTTTRCSSLDSSRNPFFLDSGATVHISPDAHDFYDLKAISPHSICDVGRSTISAVGIGSVRLPIAKGAHIQLDNVLYIPNATVHLISISSLCRDSQFTAHFDDTSCWLMKKKQYARGIWSFNHPFPLLIKVYAQIHQACFCGKMPQPRYMASSPRPHKCSVH